MGDPTACAECRFFYELNRDLLVPAAATVGIEHGVSQGTALRTYLDGYHQRGHREPDPTPAKEPTP